MPEGEPRLITTHRMEAILRHDDIEWATQCFISSKEAQYTGQQYHCDIQTMLDKNIGGYLRIYPQVFHQIEDLSISLS